MTRKKMARRKSIIPCIDWVNTRRKQAMDKQKQKSNSFYSSWLTWRATDAVDPAGAYERWAPCFKRSDVLSFH